MIRPIVSNVVKPNTSNVCTYVRIKLWVERRRDYDTIWNDFPTTDLLLQILRPGQIFSVN